MRKYIILLIAAVLFCAGSSYSRVKNKNQDAVVIFGNLGCTGNFDVAILDEGLEVCQRCEHIFNEAISNMDNLCSHNCFANRYFESCTVWTGIENGFQRRLLQNMLSLSGKQFKYNFL